MRRQHQSFCPRFFNTATLCTSFWIVLLFLIGPDIFGDSEVLAVSRLGYLVKKSGYIGPCNEECHRVHLTSPQPHALIRILSWTPVSAFYQGPWYPEGSGIFKTCKFDPPLSCEYTNDKSMLYVSDAVLFRGLLLEQYPLPPKHPPHQKWIFFESKPPRLTSITTNLTKYAHIFNLTSTYTLDSDIPLPIMRKCTPVAGQSNVKAYKGENFAAKKSHLAAWINVNHCQTVSRRENYVKHLQDHITVDIYGTCGSYRCNPEWSVDKCLQVVAPKYKFLLAFENVLCADYVSNVLWAIFDNHLKVVPVVLGSASYSNILPPGTYIDVRNFSSPGELASYLAYLDHHDEIYNEFIERRTFDTCYYRTEHAQYHCALCQHLHYYRGVSEVTLDIDHFWHKSSRCETPRHFYKNIAKEVFVDKSPSKAWQPN